MYQGYPRIYQPGEGLSVPKRYTYCGSGSLRSFKNFLIYHRLLDLEGAISLDKGRGKVGKL